MTSALRHETSKTVVLVADTETAVDLGSQIKAFQIQARDNTVIRLAFDPGQTVDNGPYWTIKAGAKWPVESWPLPLAGSNRVIYLRAVGAGATAEIVTQI